MAETPIIDGAAPWGPRDGSDLAPAPTPERAGPWRDPDRQAKATPLSEFVWGLISTLILAGWISLWAGPLGAVALIIGVFVHEFGHLMVINWAGSGPSRIRIIPFFGGAASMARPPESDFKGVLIALAGPLFGLVAAIPFYAAAAYTGKPGWLAGAFFIGALNLINLAPAAPLDGAKAAGPVLARIHPWLERGVLIVIAGLGLAWALKSGSWLFGLVLAFGVLRAFQAGVLRPPARALTWLEWTASFALYAAVVALCAWVTLAAAHGAGIHLQAPSLGFGGLK